MAPLLFLFFLSFIIRILFIFQGGVSFHYDMARDAFLVSEILSGDPKIQGPPTSTPGLYHGVLYYYLLAPGYLLGGGDPTIAALWLALINSSAVIPIYLLARSLFKSSSWAKLTGGLFAVAFQAGQYGPWLSNPSPVLLTSSWFFYSLWLIKDKPKLALPLSCFWAALSTQFQFFMVYLFLLIPIYLYLFKIKLPDRKTLIISALVTVVTLSTFVISVVKFNSLSQLQTSFTAISQTQQLEFRQTFTSQILVYLDRLFDIFIYNFIPSNVILGGLFGLVTFYLIRSQPFLLFMTLSSILIFIFGGHNSNYANVGIISPIILAGAAALKAIKGWSRPVFLLILGFIFFSNLTTLSSQNRIGQTLLVIPEEMNLKNELKLIDRSYEIAKGQPFYINTITLPLWTNTTWAYLYNWYGKSKYGYLPTFYGPNQINLLGDGVFDRTDQPLSTSLLIIEPHEGIPSSMMAKELETENYKTKLISEETFGSLKLQLRDPLSKPLPN